MRRSVMRVLTSALVGVGLLVVACGPAVQPAPTPTPTPRETPVPPGETPIPPRETRPTPLAPAVTPPSPPVRPPGEEGAKRGGILVVATTTEGPSYNPWEEAAGIAFSVGHPVSNLIISNRTTGSFEKRDFLGLEADLARSWEWSRDGLSLTLRFQEGVRFHDGQPFTCADAKWTLDSIRTGKGLKRSPRALLFKSVTAVECPDDLTMLVRLSQPSASLLDSIAMGYNMVFPKHRYEGKVEDLRNKPPFGTGPFVLKESLPGEKYVFERNSAYWRQPYPYLDGLQVPLLPNTAAVVAALRAGRVDLSSTSSSGFEGGSADTLLRECKVCQFWPRIARPSFSAFHVNHLRRPWNTPEMKDALSLAIDRTKFGKLGYGGYFTPGAGVIHPLSPYALPEGILRIIPGYDLSDPEANKRRARELLAQAGYRPGELKLNLSLWVVVATTYPSAIEDLQSVGFAVQTQTVETARGYAILGAGDFDVIPWAMALGGLDPDVPLYEHYYTGSDRNYGRYSNPEADRLIDLQAATLDMTERQRLIQQVSEILLRDQAKIILGWVEMVPVANKRVRNFLPTIASGAHYAPNHLRGERIWLEP